jgi:hypothetical protein
MNDPIRLFDPTGLDCASATRGTRSVNAETVGCNPDPDPGDPGSEPGGGPGDPGDPPGDPVDSDDSGYQEQLNSIFTDQPNCNSGLGDLGIDTTALAATAKGITFLNATDPSVASEPLWKAMGMASASPSSSSAVNAFFDQTVGAYAASSPNQAEVLPDLNGANPNWQGTGEPNLSNFVVLMPSYFNLSPVLQDLQLMHEALHIYKQMDDGQLAAFLTDDDSYYTKSQATSSNAITVAIGRAGCH